MKGKNRDKRKTKFSDLAMPSRILSSRIKDRDIYFSIFIRQCNFFCTFATQQIHNNHEILSDSLPFAGFDFRKRRNNYLRTERKQLFSTYSKQRTESLLHCKHVHVSIDDIVRLNPGSDKQIRVGEALKIPQANSSSSSKNGRFHTITGWRNALPADGEIQYQRTGYLRCQPWSECQQFPRGTGNLNPYGKCDGSGHSPRSSSIFHSFYYPERMERNA